MISRRYLAILIMMSIVIGTTASSVLTGQNVSIHSMKSQQPSMKLNIQQADSNFSAHITILISFDNIWASTFLAKNLLFNLNNTIHQIYQNVIINYEIISTQNSTSEFNIINSIIKKNNETLFPGTQYLIFLGRQMAKNIDTNTYMFAKWFNSTWNNNTTVKAVSFIDSLDSPSSIINSLPINVNASIQYYNRTVAGLIAGVWSMFASNNSSNQVGIVLPWGPSYLCYNPNPINTCNNFTDFYMGAYSGIFSGASYVDEKVKNNALYQVLSNNIDFNHSLVASNPLNLTQNENNSLISANYNVATNFIQNGIGSLVGFGNTGEEGILQAINDHKTVSGIMLDTYPYPNYDNGRIAYIYPNYTNAVLKQIAFWAKYNTSAILQQVYLPSSNSQDYILDNPVVINPMFINITQEIINSKIPFNELNQNNVQITGGYEWVSLLGGMMFMVLILKRRQNYKQKR